MGGSVYGGGRDGSGYPPLKPVHRTASETMVEGWLDVCVRREGTDQGTLHLNHDME